MFPDVKGLKNRQEVEVLREKVIYTFYFKSDSKYTHTIYIREAI